VHGEPALYFAVLQSQKTREIASGPLKKIRKKKWGRYDK